MKQGKADIGIGCQVAKPIGADSIEVECRVSELDAELLMCRMDGGGRHKGSGKNKNGSHIDMTPRSGTYSGCDVWRDHAVRQVLELQGRRHANRRGYLEGK